MLRSRSCLPGRSGEIGIRSRLKICRDLVPWGFKSPLRHNLLFNEIQRLLIRAICNILSTLTTENGGGGFSNATGVSRFEQTLSVKTAFSNSLKQPEF